MALVAVSDFMESAGINPGLESELDPAVSRAIGVAQSRLETELDSALDRRTCKDTFYLDSDRHNGVIEGGMLCLRLRNAFVQTVTSVGSADTWLGPFTAVAAYKMNADHGLLYVGKEYDGKFVEVQYTSGFAGRSECPKNIQRAIIYFIPMALKIARPVDPENKKNAESSGETSTGLLGSLRRPLGLQFRPKFYEQSP